MTERIVPWGRGGGQPTPRGSDGGGSVGCPEGEASGASLAKAGLDGGLRSRVATAEEGGVVEGSTGEGSALATVVSQQHQGLGFVAVELTGLGADVGSQLLLVLAGGHSHAQGAGGDGDTEAQSLGGRASGGLEEGTESHGSWSRLVVGGGFPPPVVRIVDPLG